MSNYIKVDSIDLCYHFEGTYYSHSTTNSETSTVTLEVAQVPTSIEIRNNWYSPSGSAYSNRYVRSLALYAANTNDDDSFELLETWSISSNTTITQTISTETAYKYYKLRILSTAGAYNSCLGGATLYLAK